MEKMIALLLVAFSLGACAAPENPTIEWNTLYTTYDVEYIDDCLHYDDLTCEFE